MERLLQSPQFEYLSGQSKTFVLAFDEAMDTLGYTSGGEIGDGYCWGRHMVIYTRVGVKSKKSYARIYLQEDGLVLRFYFSKVDGHSEAIAAKPQFIQEAFTGAFGQCGHCHNQRQDGGCSHRKCYSIAGKPYEKCDGYTFWFTHPRLEDLPAYLELFSLFYPPKRAGKQ